MIFFLFFLTFFQWPLFTWGWGYKNLHIGQPYWQRAMFPTPDHYKQPDIKDLTRRLCFVAKLKNRLMMKMKGASLTILSERPINPPWSVHI